MHSSALTGWANWRWTTARGTTSRASSSKWWDRKIHEITRKNTKEAEERTSASFVFFRVISWIFLSHHFDDDARDVVPRAVVQRQLAQPVSALLCILALGDEAQELLVRHGAAQAVSAEQEAVARL